MRIDNKWYHQTWAIVAAFIIFWPVGIYFLISRNNASKGGAFVSGLNKKQASVVGGILCFIGVFFLVGGSNAIPMTFLYIAGGIAVIIYGRKNEIKIERNKKYINMIVNNKVTSIDIIASQCGISYDQCRTELNSLIEKGVFKDAVIDEASHSITITKRAVKVNSGSENTIVNTNCSGCGAAISAPKGAVIECEYCGNRFIV